MSAKPNPIESKDAVERLAALRLLDSRKTRLGIEVGAARKKWADDLGDKSKELHKQIELPNPGKFTEAKKRLDLIRSLFEERKEIEAAKKIQLDKLTAETKKTEAAIVELIRSDLDDNQQELELEGSAGPKLNMSPDTAKMVGAAITSVRDDGGELSPSEEGLADTLSEMGVFGLSLVDDPDGD